MVEPYTCLTLGGVTPGIKKKIPKMEMWRKKKLPNPGSI